VRRGKPCSPSQPAHILARSDCSRTNFCMSVCVCSCPPSCGPCTCWRQSWCGAKCAKPWASGVHVWSAGPLGHTFPSARNCQLWLGACMSRRALRWRNVHSCFYRCAPTRPHANSHMLLHAYKRWQMDGHCQRWLPCTRTHAMHAHSHAHTHVHMRLQAHCHQWWRLAGHPPGRLLRGYWAAGAERLGSHRDVARPGMPSRGPGACAVVLAHGAHTSSVAGTRCAPVLLRGAVLVAH